MKTVMNHRQDGGLLKMIRRTDPVDPFENGVNSPYINPRTKSNSYKKGHPISGSKFNIFDIPSFIFL